MQERLQKLLAQAGYGSRRACEEFIIAGRVRVNGQIAILGQKADPSADKISLDNRPLPAREKLTYIALYKPRNIISSVDDEAGRKTVRDLIPETGTLYPVGRLDWDSEGLILMTNDGGLTNRLTHPRYGHEKEYKVLVARRPDPQQIETWRRGVVMEDGYKTAPAKVYVESGAGKGAWIRVTMGEGRNRQIREIGALLGLPVIRIVRIRIGTLWLGAMKPGDWRRLTEQEIQELQGGKAARSERPNKEKPLGRKPRLVRVERASVNDRKEKSRRESSRPTRSKK
ncbi:MAG: rRNA pseudouridine synthase [Chloroflexi bacterium]|nr:rRNA pseudouridine synthase [Chloroflexota bacterium]